MKAHALNLLVCVILMTQIRFEQASADTQATADGASLQKMLPSQQQQQLQLQQLNDLQRLSCYACSTMDYENTANNICRFMEHHQKWPSGSHPQAPNGVGHHSAPMMDYAQTTTATSTPTSMSTNIEGSTNTMPSMDRLVSSSPADVESTAHGASSASNQHSSQISQNMSLGQSYDDSSHSVNSSTTMLPTQLQTTSITPAQATQGYYPPAQYRVPHPANYIRLRRCLGHEYFCSIVSIVRLEYVNDNLVQSFWAMERNCSKECNKGCMYIGERVRLKICSHCCRTPNCNVINGALSALHISDNHSYQLVAMLLLSLFLTNALFIYKSN